MSNIEQALFPRELRAYLLGRVERAHSPWLVAANERIISEREGGPGTSSGGNLGEEPGRLYEPFIRAVAENFRRNRVVIGQGIKRVDHKLRKDKGFSRRTASLEERDGPSL